MNLPFALMWLMVDTGAVLWPIKKYEKLITWKKFLIYCNKILEDN